MLHLADTRLQDDFEIALRAVQNNEVALECVSNKLLDDRAFMP